MRMGEHCVRRGRSRDRKMEAEREREACLGED